ncbi:MAG TPA: hypothetical protein VEV17_21565 [Bryobacteraceae bacterium]|nr:hypothetical protein [Bryobacteraceae bacterium]
MNRRRSIIISRITLAIFALSLAATLAFAHGGLEHVLGTVVKASDTSITVKTTAGKMVDVNLDAKTTFAKGTQAIQKTDIKVGDRVVIHAEKSGDKLTAHTVEIGAAPAAKAAH